MTTNFGGVEPLLGPIVVCYGSKGAFFLYVENTKIGFCHRVEKPRVSAVRVRVRLVFKVLRNGLLRYILHMSKAVM